MQWRACSEKHVRLIEVGGKTWCDVFGWLTVVYQSVQGERAHPVMTMLVTVGGTCVTVIRSFAPHVHVRDFFSSIMIYSRRDGGERI